jgi:hypothetical protein
MEGGEQSESVQQFCNVTAATPEQARFFLESCAWQLETAIHSFFENDAGPAPTSPQDYGEAREEEEEEEEEDDEDDEDFVPPGGTPAGVSSRTATSAATPAPTPSAVPAGGPGVPAQGQNRWGTRSAGPTLGTGSFGAPSRGSRPKSNKDKGAARSNGGRGGITTLSDLNKHPDSDSDSDGPNEYYTGGEKRLVFLSYSFGMPSRASNFRQCRCFAASQVCRRREIFCTQGSWFWKVSCNCFSFDSPVVSFKFHKDNSPCDSATASTIGLGNLTWLEQSRQEFLNYAIVAYLLVSRYSAFLLTSS